MTMQGKTIVITGASSGIGADTARLLRQQGARVIGVDRNDPLLSLDGFVKADLSEEAGIDAAVRHLPERIDGLCNIAGVPGTSPADLVARVNYLGIRHLVARVAERMPEGGSIVNIASILGAEWPQRLEPHKALAEVAGFEAGLVWLARRPVPQATCYQYFKEALIVWTITQSQKLFLFADGGAQVLEIGGVDREQAAEDHRLHVLEPLQRLGRRLLLVGDGVADGGVGRPP